MNPITMSPEPDGIDPADGPVLIVGLGVTGCAAAHALAARGYRILLADDAPGPAAQRAATAGLGPVPIHDSGDLGLLGSLMAQAAAVIPSPGVPPTHPTCTLAADAGVAVVGELDLAQQWDDRPKAAVTGTNGKTTVTVLIERMLGRSGIRAAAAGNTATALSQAIDTDAEAFVVEASSFGLCRARRFAPDVAVWLNLAPDHLDWHADLDDYAASKARIWAAQQPDDTAVVPFDDAAVAPWAAAVRSRRVTFVTSQRLDAPCDLRYERGVLIAHDLRLVDAREMPRRRPHDLSNAAAAAAAALAMGADADAVAAELRSFDGLEHRLAPAGRIGAVSFHNDSKATAPHATVAALTGFADAVLIAGGRNKGLDLGALTTAAPRLRAVVAIGEAADEIIACFRRADGPSIELARADSMDEAVETAYRLALPAGDVLLSPGCASFDWYRGYRERGEHFIRAVSDLAARTGRARTRTPSEMRA